MGKEVPMELLEQRKLVALWHRYLGDAAPTPPTLREFYLTEVVPSDLYEYGCVFEVFDIIANGTFDWTPRDVACRAADDVDAAAIAVK